MGCPTCESQMEQGWVAMWNPIVGQKVRWQPTQPGYGRLRVPKGAAVLLAARFGGKGSSGHAPVFGLLHCGRPARPDIRPASLMTERL